MIEVNEYASTFGNVLEKNNCFKVFHKLLLGDHIKIGFFTYNLNFNWQEILPIQNIDKQTEQFRNLLLASRENLSPERKWRTKRQENLNGNYGLASQFLLVMLS